MSFDAQIHRLLFKVFSPYFLISFSLFLADVRFHANFYVYNLIMITIGRL